MKHILHILFFLISGIIPLVAQPGLPNQPASFAAAVQQQFPLERLQKYQLPQLNRRQIEREDEQQPGFRFAAPVTADYGLENSGEWIELDNGDLIWRLKLQSKDGLGLAALYDQFYLPPGAQLFMYSLDRQQVQGPYTSFHNQSSGKFLTGFIQGSDAVIEYYEPSAARGKGRIHINRVDIAYHQDNWKSALRSSLANEFGFGTSAACHANVNCSEGDDYQKEKRATCRILMVVEEGSGFCTGNLINNARQDNTPYVLSAFHCQDGFTPLYDLWRFDFNFEAAGCSNPTDEPTYQSILGCTRRAGRQQNDFLLLELSQTIPANYSAYFLGWSRLNTVPLTATLIHHPRGDIKKIAFMSRPIRIFPGEISWDNNISTPSNHHFAAEFGFGNFEVGSSGGALLDQNNRIVGQLHGGTSDCENGSAFFGRLSLAWEGGGSKTSRLKDWLDPDGIGITTLNGRENLSAQSISLGGLVLTENGDPVPDTKIRLVDQEGKKMELMVGNSGSFNFLNVPAGKMYQIEITREDNDTRNGLSVFDLIKVRKHILNIEPFASPYQLIAADVNASGSISTLDLILMQKIILGIDSAFANVPSWIFVPSQIEFDMQDSNPIQNFHIGNYTIKNTTVNINNYDIIAIKAGDVNASASLKQP